MYKNNDEAIAWEAKKLLDEGIYTDTEQAYLEAEKIVIHIREQEKQRQVKQQFKLKIRSIKHKINSGKDYAPIPYTKNKNHWEN
ncbi:hypothetical protein [Yersinia aleksiciae]|uniref:Uncharacterized protein n=1 Tax=Yersinia aleksiciae TaxID=263819 RepID=A0ABN4H369_YERAE|nr:hypothetical protein [Yersinia aleksiciae]AKP32794.1 hypothetical protein ACZ76_04120 [Yersinia aleksiciae]CFQ51004.1 Uncharacterised protein [Yersinia aleksiciae]